MLDDGVFLPQEKGNFRGYKMENENDELTIIPGFWAFYTLKQTLQFQQ